MILPVLEKIEDTPILQTQIRVIRQHGPKWQLEKRVQSSTTRINRRDPGRGQDNMLLFRMLTDIFQEGRFSGTRQKNRLPCVRNQAQGILKFQVIGI